MATLPLLSSPSGDGSLLTGTPWGGVTIATHSAAATLGTSDLGKTHVCTVTTAYTVTLPAASGSSGKVITVVVAGSSTNLLTLAAAGTDTIDGQATRLLWAGEAAILYCDGTTWTKVGGRSIPLVCQAQRQNSSVTTLTDNAWNTIPMDTQTVGPAFMYDATNGQIVVKRPAYYECSSSIYIRTATWPTDGYGGVSQTTGGTTNNIPGGQGYSYTNRNSAGSLIDFQTLLSCAAGDLMNAVAQPASGSGFSVDGTGAPAVLTVLEIPQW